MTYCYKFFPLDFVSCTLTRNDFQVVATLTRTDDYTVATVLVTVHIHIISFLCFIKDAILVVHRPIAEMGDWVKLLKKFFWKTSIVAHHR